MDRNVVHLAADAGSLQVLHHRGAAAAGGVEVDQQRIDVPCRLCSGGTRDRLHQRRQVGDLPVVAVGERLEPGYAAPALLTPAEAEIGRPQWKESVCQYV